MLLLIRSHLSLSKCCDINVRCRHAIRAVREDLQRVLLSRLVLNLRIWLHVSVAACKDEFLWENNQ